MAGFPFVRFPSIVNSNGLAWGSSVTSARQEAFSDGFFDVDVLPIAQRAEIGGGYAMYFDCNFDFARASTCVLFFFFHVFVSKSFGLSIVSFMSSNIRMLCFAAQVFEVHGRWLLHRVCCEHA